MNQSKKKIGIIGARGYSGLELTRLLLRHPHAEILACFAGESAFSLSDYLPESPARRVDIRPLSELPGMLSELDTVFLATPAEASLELAPQILAAKAGTNVIDLSGAFRLKADGSAASQRASYKKWYKFNHPYPELLNSAIFGLVPFAGAEIRSAANVLVANPGCYATSILMALIPLLREGVIENTPIVIDAKSGTTGAGRKAAENLLFTEVDGECLPYRVGAHQHLPEICENMKFFAGTAIDPHFATHLLPTRRGIISSIYADLKTGRGAADIQVAYESAFKDYPLVRFGAIDGGAAVSENHQLAAALGLSLKRVVGTARTHIQYKVEGRKLYLFSLIDNLLKGAASQALENFNQLYGFPVDTGLGNLEGTL